jgi:hypothetical protein
MTKKDILTKIFRIIIILSAIIGIVLNASNSVEPSKQFIYFTLQSNVLVAIVYIILIFLKKESRIFNLVKNQATVAIILTGLVFNLLLRPVVDGYDYNPNTISDFLVHSLTSFLVLIDFIFFTNHGKIKKIDPVYWLIFPFIYWIFTIIYVAFGGNFNGETYESNYPYFLLNFKEYGIVFFLLVVIFVLIISYMLFYIDKLMFKRRK